MAHDYEGTAKVAEAVAKYGGYVPNYRARGEHHYRVPFKDKSHLVGVRPHPEWTKVPEHRTLTELKAKRRAERLPDATFDIDGDGVVGPTDYFVAKTFAKDQANRLDTAERGKVVEALEDGFLDRYSWGYDEAGAARKNVVKQLRGRIFKGDNGHELSHVYPPHWNAEKVPNYWTANDMKIDRKQQLLTEATALKDDHDAKHPWHIPEPPVRQEGLVDEPPFTSRRQKAAQLRKEARLYGGLDADVSAPNAARDDIAPGLSYVENPVARTRPELKAQRREQMVQALEAAREEGLNNYVPPQVRHVRMEHQDYEARRPNPDAKTRTKLLDERKRSNMEYNMQHFPHRYKEVPMFSEQDVHWWTQRANFVADPTPAKEPKAVANKVTEVMPKQCQVPEAQDLEADGIAGMRGSLERTPRWTTHFLPKGLLQKVPRHFDKLFQNGDAFADGVKQAPSLSTDTAPMESFSSFRMVRDSVSNMQNSVSMGSEHSMRSGVSKTMRIVGEMPTVNETQETGSVADKDIFRSSTGISRIDRRPSQSVDTHSARGRTASSAGFRRSMTRRMSGEGQQRFETVSPVVEDPPMTARLTRKAPVAEEQAVQVMPSTASFRRQNSMMSRQDQFASSRGSTRRWETPPPAPQTLAVRASGFQWVEKQANASSAPPPEPPSRGGSQRASVLEPPKAAE